MSSNHEEEDVKEEIHVPGTRQSQQQQRPLLRSSSKPTRTATSSSATNANANATTSTSRKKPRRKSRKAPPSSQVPVEGGEPIEEEDTKLSGTSTEPLVSSSSIGSTKTVQETVPTPPPTTTSGEGGQQQQQQQQQQQDPPMDGQRKKRKRRPPLVPWRKPKGMPRRPLSAYNFFFKAERELLLTTEGAAPAPGPAASMGEEETAATTTTTEGADDDTAAQPTTTTKRKKVPKSNKTVGIGFANLARNIATKWKTLDPESRRPFEQEAEKEKNRYNEEMLVWRAKQKEEKEQAEAIAKVAGGVGGGLLYQEDGKAVAAADGENDEGSSRLPNNNMFPLSASHAPASWPPPSDPDERALRAQAKSQFGAAASSTTTMTGPPHNNNDMFSVDMISEGFSPISLRDSSAYPEDWFDVGGGGGRAKPPSPSSSSSSSRGSRGGRGGNVNVVTVSRRGMDNAGSRGKQRSSGRNTTRCPPLQLFMDGQHQQSSSSSTAPSSHPPIGNELGGIPPSNSDRPPPPPWTSLARRDGGHHHDWGQNPNPSFGSQQQQQQQPKSNPTPSFPYPDAWFEAEEEPDESLASSASRLHGEPNDRLGKVDVSGKLPSSRKPSPGPLLPGTLNQFKSGRESSLSLPEVGLTGRDFHRGRPGSAPGRSMDAAFAALSNPSGVSTGRFPDLLLDDSPPSPERQQQHQQQLAMGELRSCEELASEFAAVASHKGVTSTSAGGTASGQHQHRPEHLVEHNSLRALGSRLDAETMDFFTNLEFSSGGSGGSSHG